MKKSVLSVLSVACLLSAVLSITACGDADDNKPPSSAAAKVGSVKNGPDLTSEYLSGQWCHTYDENGEQRDEENINWEFHEDGKFYMQKNRQSATIKHAGFWDVENGGLQIKPIYGKTYHPVTIISNDEFIMKFFVNQHIQRGACK